MNSERLLYCASLLRKKESDWRRYPKMRPRKRQPWLTEGPSRHFNMDAWMISVPYDCGFSGCAIGIYVEYGDPEKTGLRFRLIAGHFGVVSNDTKYVSGFHSIEHEFDIQDISVAGCRYSTAEPETMCSLQMRASRYLFAPEAYPQSKRRDPLFVASRIEEFVRTHEVSAAVTAA